MDEIANSAGSTQKHIRFCAADDTCVVVYGMRMQDVQQYKETMSMVAEMQVADAAGMARTHSHLLA